MKPIVWHYLLIVSVAVVVLFTNLDGARLWDRDEPRNAGCALEMMQRGDWVVPIFNDQLRDAKPVLLYWLIMTAYSIFGVNEFAARFWSAALAVATVLATYHIGRRLFHAKVGLWSAIILSTSLMFDVAGRAATPDSVLALARNPHGVWLRHLLQLRHQGPLGGRPLGLPPHMRRRPRLPCRSSTCLNRPHGLSCNFKKLERATAPFVTSRRSAATR